MTSADILLQQYDLATQWVLHQDQRRWTLLGSIVVLEGLLADAVSRVVAQGGSGRVIAFYLSTMGAFFALSWIALLWRSRVYLEDRARLVQSLGIQLGINESYSFYSAELTIPERIRSSATKWSRTRMRLVSRVSYYLLSIIASGWAVIALTMVEDTPFPRFYFALCMMELSAALAIVGATAFSRVTSSARR